jgi:hypothetical protein
MFLLSIKTTLALFFRGEARINTVNIQKILKKSDVALPHLWWSLLGLAIFFLLNIGDALAICPCGDGVCNPSCIPPENPNSCPADCGPPPVDSIRVQNVGLDAGLLIDGAESSSGAVVNDGGRVSTVAGDVTIDVGRLKSAAAPNRNEAIGFGTSRAPRRGAIYWINTVEGSTTTGWSDFGARIVMGKNTGDELLVHELGHALSLRHPADCGGSTAEFDPTNVMWPCSNSRQFFSEGQIFRGHFNTDSSINVLYNARPGEPTAGCQNGAQSEECPALNRRLWADGGFPAN